MLQAANEVRVYNNGDGVPVEVHKEEGVYVPELIFGHLLTSSNYNDEEKKVCAGCRASDSQILQLFWGPLMSRVLAPCASL